MTDKRLYLYDTTLRDGAQTQGVDFSVRDKRWFCHELDTLGIDYIEAGWPGANPTDDALFADPPRLKTARLTAFGMTRKASTGAANDPQLNALLNNDAPAVCIVAKAWDFQVTTALGISLDENLTLVRDSVAHVAASGKEAIVDAEHFFDGYKANPDYALRCLHAIADAGARWMVLCDTNGGTLPQEIHTIAEAVAARFGGERLGIHCHNDTENAVANSLAAVQAGVRMIQGTLNGLGERCGNANLTALLPTLILKLGYTTGVTPLQLAQLTRLSRQFDERLNRLPNRHAAYVGEAAFAHKGGLHVSAVAKDPRTYEHIDPALVGNKRHVIVSDQAGRANILARLKELDLAVDLDDARLQALVDKVKLNEFKGLSYDAADASFELLARRTLADVPAFYDLRSFRVIDERRWNARQELITLSEATVKVEVKDTLHMAVAEGNGPVNALDKALRSVLVQAYPCLEDMRLVDYKVRILTPNQGTEAVTRVMITSHNSEGKEWTTVGVSTNVIDASYNALQDAIRFYLLRKTAL